MNGCVESSYINHVHYVTYKEGQDICCKGDDQNKGQQF